MPNVILFAQRSEESLDMLRFAMANATLRERYIQHDKTGSFILWLTLSKKLHPKLICGTRDLNPEAREGTRT